MRAADSGRGTGGTREFGRDSVRRKLLLAVLLVTCLSAPAFGQVTGDTNPPGGEAGASYEVENPLRPGDLVRLRIWREPDLSGDYLVDERGNAVFPKIGVRNVTGLDPDALRELLIEEFRRYLVNPSIEVVFLRRVNILGAVRNPGLFPLDPTMTVSDALALAGGSLAHGEPDKVRLIRDGTTLTGKITQGTRIADLSLRSGDQLYVPERSWVSRNAGVVISSLISVAVALIVR